MELTAETFLTPIFCIFGLISFGWVLMKWAASKIWSWVGSFFAESEATRLKRELPEATTYDAWAAIADRLDEILPKNLEWKYNPTCDLYNYKLIRTRANALWEATRTDNFPQLFSLVESGLERNLGSITNPRLFNCLYGGTKFLIENYVQMMVDAVGIVFDPQDQPHGLSHQQKLDYLDFAQRSFARTALVLQGGSIFGLYHIGVMRALHERGLLPRIVLGTGTGALMAALVGIHTDDELPEFLNGGGINLDAFAEVLSDNSKSTPFWFDILGERVKRFYKSGYVLDREVLERCVEANVGDMTFQEAYRRTGRMLNIAISCDAPGTPNCLNYLTTPYVLIRSAAMASNETDETVAPSMILEKNSDGEIVAWSLNDESPEFRETRKNSKRTSTRYDRNTPLYRISQLWNVQHFMISQARPYLIPFLAPALHRSNAPGIQWLSWQGFWGMIWRWNGRELKRRMHQLDMAVGLPRGLRRFLIDEKVPFKSITMVPEIRVDDFLRLLHNPTKEEIDYWILLGEKSVWPCVAELKVRCDIELALDRCEREMQSRRHRRSPSALEMEEYTRVGGSTRRRMRARSDSADTNPI